MLKKVHILRTFSFIAAICIGLATLLHAGFSPLNSVRPDYTLVNLRPNGFIPNVSALAWLDQEKDQLLVVEWSKGGNKQVEIRQFNGTIYLLDGVSDATGPGDVKWKIWADKLEIPTGVVVLGDTVYVTSGFTLDGHIDTDKDGTADKVHKVFDWGYDKKCRHEFFMGLIYKDGDFYASSSRCKDEGSHSHTWQMHKGRGGHYKINRFTGEEELLAGGLREPYGMGVGPMGDHFECDNQGSWLPSSKMVHLQKGKFYGYHAENFSLREDYGDVLEDEIEDPPAIWMPHSVASHSPTHPILVKHGIFTGHMLVGDMAYGGVQRAFLEKVNGEWQGAYFNWSGGFESGPGALLWTADGSLIVGGQGKGDLNNWGWNGKKEGLQKIVPKPNAPVVFEPLAVRSRKNGFEIEFTKEVNESEAVKTSNYSMSRYEQQSAIGYGAGNMAARTRFSASSARLSPDKKSVFLEIDIPGSIYRSGRLQLNTGVEININDAVKSSTGDNLWVKQVWYTLNSVSNSEAFQVNGCKDEAYEEYNADAEVDDGTCVNLKEVVKVRSTEKRPAASISLQSGLFGYEFKINSTILPERVELLGLNGQRVHSFNIKPNGQYRLGNARVNPGMYFIAVSVAGKQSFKKIVLSL